MLAKLYDYFGWVGIASLSAWLATPVLLVLFYLLSRWRSRGHTLAVLVAVAAVVLAYKNSDNVDEIEKDVFNPMAMMGLPLPQEEQKPEPQYEYRKAGRQERVLAPENAPPGNAPAVNTPAMNVPAVLLAPPEVLQPANNAARKLPEAQYEEAHDLNDANILASWVILGIATLVTLVTYGLALHTHFSGRGNLGTWAPSRPTACVSPVNPYLTGQLLQRVVQHGDMFIYLGTYKPPTSFAQPYLAGDEMHFRPVKVVRCRSLAELHGPGLFFESVWYGYSCLVVLGAGVARQALLEAGEFCAAHAARALPARKTVNLIWALDEPPPKETVERLQALSAAANVRFVWATAGPCAPELTAVFEEHYAPQQG